VPPVGAGLNGGKREPSRDSYILVTEGYSVFHEPRLVPGCDGSKTGSVRRIHSRQNDSASPPRSVTFIGGFGYLDARDHFPAWGVR
jgi:hypothetical protein